jgi:hypothetical protein
MALYNDSASAPSFFYVQHYTVIFSSVPHPHLMYVRTTVDLTNNPSAYDVLETAGDGSDMASVPEHCDTSGGMGS